MLTHPRPKPVITKKQQPSMAGKEPEWADEMAEKSILPQPMMKKPAITIAVTMVMICWRRMIRS